MKLFKRTPELRGGEMGPLPMSSNNYRGINSNNENNSEVVVSAESDIHPTEETTIVMTKRSNNKSKSNRTAHPPTNRTAYAAVADHSDRLDEEDDDNGMEEEIDEDDVEAMARHSRLRQGVRRIHSDATSHTVWYAFCCAGVAFYLWILVGLLLVVIGGFILGYHPNGALVATAVSPPLPPTTGGSSSSSTPSGVTYDPSVAALPWNPYNLQTPAEATSSSTTSGWTPMNLPPLDPAPHTTNGTASSATTAAIMGYSMQPDIVNDTVVFVSDGNLYWTRLESSSSTPTNLNPPQRIAAVRLTTTVGNVRSPKINPVYPYWIAFTATYHNRRDVYVVDLRGQHGGGGSGTAPVQRLTYVDSAYGVNSLSGWSQDGNRLVYSASATAVGLRDVRLYEMAVRYDSDTDGTVHTDTAATTATGTTTDTASRLPKMAQQRLHVWETRPIPLAQATEGVVWATSTTDDSTTTTTTQSPLSECLYFVRYKQGSHTARYVGGTAEQLWAYCDGEDHAVPLTYDYPGTSKHPTVIRLETVAYLLFLSDRSPMDPEHLVGPTVFHSNDQKWRATSMNLWAVPLPTWTDLYHTTAVDEPESDTTKKYVMSDPIQLTRISCQFNGLALQEYAVDGATGAVILRIGADLFHLSATDVRSMLLRQSPATTTTTTTTVQPTPLVMQVVSDFHEQHERLIQIDMLRHLSRADVFATDFGTLATLLTVRGQVFVAPVIAESEQSTSTTTSVPHQYQGSGENIPERRYRVIPGAMTGGSIRVLAALHVPLYAPAQNAAAAGRRLSLVLATDPQSPTAEHGFYLVEVQADSVNGFTDLRHLPSPFLGGHVNGGRTQDGGLGSVNGKSVAVSPCGRRFAWTDTDDRICVMTLPIYNNSTLSPYNYQCLPRSNDMGEPMAGTLSSLTWSPGGRYLGVEHNALNQFVILSIVDCGDPEPSPANASVVRDIEIGKASQVTPSRFNSYGLYWGASSFDMFLSSLMMSLGLPTVETPTLYFLSDRDVVSDVTSPWGSRAPMPHFISLEGYLYALPLPSKLDGDEIVEPLSGRFPGGGTLEVFQGDLNSYEDAVLAASGAPPNAGDPRRNLKAYVYGKLSDRLQGRKLRPHEERVVLRYLKATEAPPQSNVTAPSPFRKDPELALPADNLAFAHKAYRMARIPKGKYTAIASQTPDDGSLVLIERDDTAPTGSYDAHRVHFFSANPFPSDILNSVVVPGVSSWGLSSSRNHLYFVASHSGKIKVVPNTAAGLTAFTHDISWSQMQSDTTNLAISVWPALEYRSIFGDAWRLLRDYFYDSNMHSVDWKAVHDRYEPLVQRCAKREELDDVLGQMSSETSALHSFVYGGEYSSPEQPPMLPASLGASLKRTPAWKGYMVTEIPERDPDFDIVDGVARYCPISEQALHPTGQMGLKVGDVIVAVNGESVFMVPDINMMLRGMAGRSVRLDVLRLQSGIVAESGEMSPEPVIVVPIGMLDADDLRYGAWEWKTAKLAKYLAKKSGISVGYVYMQAMDRNGEDSFARGFFPDHDKDALIIDVRHNSGGNIDSWIITMLQRKAWMYWAGRGGDKRYGELDWNEQFAFRGKIIVLVDELTSSDGEGVARGISELGLGKIIGKRTWGGGIWGSSANRLVDGGIAAAPQWGIFNEKFGWGGGIEMVGVSPDIEVDNEPRATYDGRDMQLERAIAELKSWLKKEPVPAYQTPTGGRPDMSLHDEDCPA